jgi:Fis family transcriptional regulator, factor for inversion stimulation protein
VDAVLNAVVSLRPQSSPHDELQPALRDCVARAVSRYLEDIGEGPTVDLYRLVIDEVEAPMLATVLAHYEGNQSRAAQALGLSRATLRKKLRHFHIL